MFDVSDAPFNLSLSAGTAGTTGLRCQSSIPAEGLETWIPDHLTGFTIVGRNQRGGVVTEDLLGKAAEVSEGSIESFEPVILPLREESPAVETPRISQNGGHQVDLHGLPGDSHDLFAEVDLNLMARCGLEPDCGQGLRPLFLAKGRNSSLQGSQINLKSAIGQFLLNDDGVPLGDGTKEILNFMKRAGVETTAGRS